MNTVRTLADPKRSAGKAFIIAWALGSCFYFLEYVVRSSPAVMMPDLSRRLGISSLAMSSILGAYYYTYAVTSLVAGIALDKAGARFPISIGIGILATGCLLFALPTWVSNETGRLLQGAGSAFAFTGCVYLASHGFSPRSMATAIGLTQCIGMLGGSVGQFVVGPLIRSGLSVGSFWMGLGIIGGGICTALLFIIPKEEKKDAHGTGVRSLLIPYKIVFTNLQSWLSGMISGLLFAPTTIFAMTWGIAFFQQDRYLSFESAVMTCAMVPLGWVVGCPLLGWLSDKMGRRKPAIIIGCLVMMLSLGQLLFLPGLLPAALSMFIFGVASGSAMIPYTVIKEANPDNVKGSATGGINFITFSITSLLGPVFAGCFGKTLQTTTDHAQHFQQAGAFFLVTTALALVVSLIIKETGHAKTN